MSKNDFDNIRHVVSYVTVKEIKDQLDMLERSFEFNDNEIMTAITMTQNNYGGELGSAFMDQVLETLFEAKK